MTACYSVGWSCLTRCDTDLGGQRDHKAHAEGVHVRIGDHYITWSMPMGTIVASARLRRRAIPDLKVFTVPSGLRVPSG